MEHIDNTPLFDGAMNVIAIASDLLTRLENVEKDTPEKEETYSMIKTVVTTQSEVIRRLVEHQATITDKMNNIIDRLP